MNYLPIARFRFDDPVTGDSYKAKVFGRFHTTQEDANKQLTEIVSLTIDVDANDSPVPVLIVNEWIHSPFPSFVYKANDGEDVLPNFISGRMIASKDRIVSTGPIMFDLYAQEIALLDMDAILNWVNKTLNEKMQIEVPDNFLYVLVHGLGGIYLLETFQRLLKKDEQAAVEYLFKIIAKRFYLPEYDGDISKLITQLKSAVPQLFNESSKVGDPVEFIIEPSNAEA